MGLSAWKEGWAKADLHSTAARKNITQIIAAHCLNTTQISLHTVWILLKYHCTLFEYYSHMPAYVCILTAAGMGGGLNSEFQWLVRMVKPRPQLPGRRQGVPVYSWLWFRGVALDHVIVT